MRDLLRLLRVRNFALLWTASLISQIGDWVLRVALPFHIYQQTGSALATGEMFIVETLPMIAFSSVAGVFVDRWNRKRILITTDLLQCLLTLLLIFVHSPESFWIIYAVGFAQSLVGQFANPADNAILPQVVGEEQLVAANGALSVNNNLARLIGPSLGGALLLALGLSGVVVADALSFLLSAMRLLFLTLAAATTTTVKTQRVGATTSHRVLWREWSAGLRVITGERWLIALFTVMGIAVLGDGMFTVLSAPFVNKTLHGSADVYGWTLTARGFGGLLGGLVIGQIGKYMRPGRLIGICAMLMGALLVAMVWLSTIPATLLITVVVGMPAIGFFVSVPTLLQLGVPDAYRGRVFGSFYAVNALMVLLGMLLASGTGDLLGIRPLLFGAGCLYALAGVLALVFLARNTLHALSAQLPSDTSAVTSAV